MEAHPGLAPGKSVLQTDGSTALPCAPQDREKWGDQWDSHPTRRLSQSRMLLLHHDLHLKVDPATGAAPVWARLQDECIRWRPRMDLRHQPPESESGALLIELQG